MIRRSDGWKHDDAARRRLLLLRIHPCERVFDGRRGERPERLKRHRVGESEPRESKKPPFDQIFFGQCEKNSSSFLTIGGRVIHAKDDS